MNRCRSIQLTGLLVLLLLVLPGFDVSDEAQGSAPELVVDILQVTLKDYTGTVNLMDLGYNLTDGDTFEILVKVRNAGTLAAQNVKIGVFNNDPAHGGETLLDQNEQTNLNIVNGFSTYSQIDGGGSVTIETTFKYSASRYYNIFVKSIDGLGQITNSSQPLPRNLQSMRHFKWWDYDYGYRIPVIVQNKETTRKSFPIEYRANFSRLFDDMGLPVILDDTSIRVVEYDHDGEPKYQGVADQNDYVAACQFEPDGAYVDDINEKGVVVWMMDGTNEPYHTRYFMIYYDDLNGSEKGLPDFQDTDLYISADTGGEWKPRTQLPRYVTISGGFGSLKSDLQKGGVLLNAFSNVQDKTPYGSWRFMALNDGSATYYDSKEAYPDVMILKGPIRVKFSIRGDMSNGAGGPHPSIDYFVNYTFYSGSNLVEIKEGFVSTKDIKVNSAHYSSEIYRDITGAKLYYNTMDGDTISYSGSAKANPMNISLARRMYATITPYANKFHSLQIGNWFIGRIWMEDTYNWANKEVIQSVVSRSPPSAQHSGGGAPPPQYWHYEFFPYLQSGVNFKQDQEVYAHYYYYVNTLQDGLNQAEMMQAQYNSLFDKPNIKQLTPTGQYQITLQRDSTEIAPTVEKDIDVLVELSDYRPNPNGTFEENFNISIVEYPEFWNVSLFYEEQNGSVINITDPIPFNPANDLPVGWPDPFFNVSNFYDIKLKVKLPENITENYTDFITLRLVTDNGVDMEIIYSIEVKVSYEVEIKITGDETTRFVPLGSEAEFQLEIVNTGTVPDVYDLEVNILAFLYGWDVSLSEYSVEQMPEDSTPPPLPAIVDLLCLPPVANIGENEEMYLAVTATSTKHPDSTDTVFLKIVGNSDMAIDVIPIDEHQYFSYSESLYYDVRIFNSGNVTDNITINDVATPIGWTAIPETTFFPEVPENGYRDVRILVTAPDIGNFSLAPAWEKKELVIKASSERIRGLSGKGSVFGEVKQIYNISMTDVEGNITPAPGTPTNYTFFLNNFGNGLDYVNVTLQSDYFFERISRIPLSIKENRTVNISVVIPVFIPDHDHIVFVNVSDGHVSDSRNFTISINRYYNPEVTLDDDEYVASPGETIDYIMDIKNGGNGQDWYSFSTAPMYSQWIELPNAGAYIPEQKMKYYLNLTLPEGSLATLDGHIYSIPINVSVNNGTIPRTFYFILSSRMYDIRITELSMNSDTEGEAPKQNQILGVKARVENQGNLTLTDVEFSMTVDGEVIGVENLPVLSESAYVVFLWPGEEGNHDLEVSLTSNHAIYDLNPEDSKAVINIRVKEAKAAGDYSQSYLFAAPVAVVGAVLLVMRRKPPGDDDGEV